MFANQKWVLSLSLIALFTLNAKANETCNGLIEGTVETTKQTAFAEPRVRGLHLEAPVAPPILSTHEATSLVPLPQPAVRNELNERAAEYVNKLAALDSNSPEFGKKVEELTSMGRTEIQAAASISNRFLDRPTQAIEKEGGVGKNLRELRLVVESLDPSKQTGLLGPQKLWGLIPAKWRNPFRDYFRGYQSSQTQINSILTHLSNGKTELQKDNAGIDTERQNLWKTMEKLNQMVILAKTLDASLEEKATALDSTDPVKAKLIRETALFEIRQRTTDLLTQLAVSVQGYLALDVVKKNNVELIKGVDRAGTTTVAALRTAVTVASALTNQKLVLNQITALNETTANMIDSTSAMLKQTSARIHEQATSSMIPLETLQRAFTNIYDTMDAIDTFKVNSLAAMKTTVNTLSVEVEKSRGYVARAEGANGKSEASKLQSK